MTLSETAAAKLGLNTPGTRHGLLIAGGAGTRLWPLSRRNRPKQLLELTGSGHSLLQDAFLRLCRRMPPERVLVVTGTEYEAAILQQIRELAPGYPAANILAEPVGRDSAPAVLWGALRIHQRCPDAQVSMVWADQLVRHEDTLDAALDRAEGGVAEGGIAIVGVPASSPNTALGYIKMGQEISAGVHRAAGFTEKPDAAKAAELVRQGGYLWNPGVFVFHVGTMLAEFERFAPAMHGPLARMEADGTPTPATVAEVYGPLPKDSIDYAVLEKTEQLVLVPAELGWSDLGSWDELQRQGEKDAHGNTVMGNSGSGKTVLMDTRNTLVHGGKRLIATVGVENLVIVDTEDALLICNLDKVQDIKKLVAELERQGLPEGSTAPQSQRPWGHYRVLAEGPGFQVKELVVNPGGRMSLQLHHKRSEHWVVVEGQPALTLGEETRTFQTGEYLFVPVEEKHRIANPGTETVRIIEVQQGSYLGEDDIERFEDIYGRA